MLRAKGYVMWFLFYGSNQGDELSYSVYKERRSE